LISSLVVSYVIIIVMSVYSALSVHWNSWSIVNPLQWLMDLVLPKWSHFALVESIQSNVYSPILCTVVSLLFLNVPVSKRIWLHHWWVVAGDSEKRTTFILEG
jgi:hypothetical protein